MGLDIFFGVVFFVIMYFFVVAFFGFFVLIKEHWLVISLIVFFYLIFHKSIHKFLRRLWKKKIYSILIIIISVLAVGILLIISVGYGMTRSSDKAYSPDRKYFAQVVEINCGATCSYDTNVVITNAKTPFVFSEYLSAWTGNRRGVFGTNGSLDSMSASWIYSDTLKVTFSDCSKIYGQQKSWRDIKIVYEGKCSKNW